MRKLTLTDDVNLLCAAYGPAKAVARIKRRLQTIPGPNSLDQTWLRVADDGRMQLGWSLQSGASYCVSLPFKGELVVT